MIRSDQSIAWYIQLLTCQMICQNLTQACVDFLGVCFEWVEGGGVITTTPSPCLNLLKICHELEIWYVSTHTYLVFKNVPFSTKALLILRMLAFFGKNSTLRKAIV